MVYSLDGITGTESVSAHRHLTLLLSNNLKWDYSDIYGFVRARMSLAIDRSNTLILQGARDKKAYICQIPDLEDGVVMELLARWKG